VLKRDNGGELNHHLSGEPQPQLTEEAKLSANAMTGPARRSVLTFTATWALAVPWADVEFDGSSFFRSSLRQLVVARPAESAMNATLRLLMGGSQTLARL
jgi:hypothetical protein